MFSFKMMKCFMQSGFSALIGISAKSLNSSSYWMNHSPSTVLLPLGKGLPEVGAAGMWGNKAVWWDGGEIFRAIVPAHFTCTQTCFLKWGWDCSFSSCFTPALVSWIAAAAPLPWNQTSKQTQLYKPCGKSWLALHQVCRSCGEPKWRGWWNHPSPLSGVL